MKFLSQKVVLTLFCLFLLVTLWGIYQSERTIRWKEFISPNLNYSIQYPSTWFVDSASKKFVLEKENDTDHIRNENTRTVLEMSKNNAGSISIKKYKKEKEKDLMDFISTLQSEYSFHESRIISESYNIRMGRFTGIQQLEIPAKMDTGATSTEIYIDVGDNTVYVFSIFYFEKTAYDRNSETINKILQSFKVNSQLE